MRNFARHSDLITIGFLGAVTVVTMATLGANVALAAVLCLALGFATGSVVMTLRTPPATTTYWAVLAQLVEAADSDSGDIHRLDAALTDARTLLAERGRL